MLKINKEHIARAAKGLGKLVAYGTLFAAYLGNVNSKTEVYYQKSVGYSDAVKVIVNSSMLDSYKREALQVLIHDRDADYYEAVISIVKSSMLGCSKIDAIKTLS